MGIAPRVDLACTLLAARSASFKRLDGDVRATPSENLIDAQLESFSRIAGIEGFEFLNTAIARDK